MKTRLVARLESKINTPGHADSVICTNTICLNYGLSRTATIIGSNDNAYNTRTITIPRLAREKPAIR